MKLPDVLTGLLPKREEIKEYFFSLYVDRDAAAIAVWHVDGKGSPKVESFAHAVIAEDSWEARTHVVDRLLSAAEDKVGVQKAITKTVFGMPGVYLTEGGNISEAVRPHLRKLSQMLELTPVGFVPLSQAIAFQFKKDEGVPPSVILIGCSGDTAHVILFRVGNPTHDDTIDLGEDPAAALEAVLKKHQDGDVLPSRILLYGGNVTHIEEIKAKLLKHPWPTRTNFLHFPKIEIASLESLLTSVSLAGASELAKEMKEPEDGGPPARLDESAKRAGEAGVASTVVAQARTGISEQGTGDSEELETGNEEPADEEEKESEDEEIEEDEEEETGEASESVSAQRSLEKGDVLEKESEDEDVANVQVVTPESLGFRHEDVLERISGDKPDKPSLSKGFKKPRFSLPKQFTLPHVSLPDFGNVQSFFMRLPKVRGGAIPVIIGVVILLFVSALLYYSLPRATVTVLVSASSVDESTGITVDPKATVADSENKIIPGKTKEQSVSGEKTVTVSGKKNVGDPAKGTVTIYNKVTSSRTLPKGTVLTSGAIAFTLDSDVSVASASESIGSITFGKTTANVTAREIGPNGNLSASSEFSFSNISSSQVSARNDAAFTGGTSKQVTVVSRADQDALVKALTDELVTKAKQQLLSEGVSGERLIDQTIKTAVTEKVFDAELDQEAKELHGNVTITVSGIAISDSDVKAVLSPLVEAKIPSGYRLAPEQTQVTVSNVSIKKDGTITLTAKMTAIALPQIDSDALKTKLVGKKVTEATDTLRQTTGVAGAEYRFVLSPITSRLPLNRNNISITVMVQ